MLKIVWRTLVLSLAASSAFAVTFTPIAGEISVITSSTRRSVAVTVSNNNVVTAQFCVSLPEPLPEPINVTERGQVIYAPQPIEGLPPGTKINSPEPIAQSLTIVPEKSPSLAFVARGVKPIYNATKVIVISNVARQDWLGPNNIRRVPGVEACLAPGG